MEQTLVVDLERNRSRLNYYVQKKAANPATSKKAGPLDRWIEIYEERVKKLERQATKLGLRTEIDKPAINSKKNAS